MSELSFLPGFRIVRGSYKVSEAAILTCPWHHYPSRGETTQRPLRALAFQVRPSRLRRGRACTMEERKLRHGAFDVVGVVGPCPAAQALQCCRRAAATRLRTDEASKGWSSLCSPCWLPLSKSPLTCVCVCVCSETSKTPAPAICIPVFGIQH